MTGRAWRRIGLCLLVLAAAACGIKGDPVPPRDAEDAARSTLP